LIEENCREVRSDLVGLNIWWNLSILRDTLKGGGPSNLVLLSPGRFRKSSNENNN
jgi:hypothetical protein